MSPDPIITARPLALVILDGWGFAPRTEENAIAMAHTPNYDEICRRYPMTTLAACGEPMGMPSDAQGSADFGHLSISAGRVVETEAARIAAAIASGDFANNAVLLRAFERVRSTGGRVHLIGLVSDAGVHSSTENLFALLRIAKAQGANDVFVHCILDGVDVPPRSADVFLEALEIKLADIGVGRLASLVGRFLAMDTTGHWERTARVFTMLVHGEGERAGDAVMAVRNSFLRGIADEFIAPIVIEGPDGEPVGKIRNGDLVVFFNHRGDGMVQLVRSLCVPEGQSGAKPDIDTVCLTEYDRSFNLPAAFRQERLRNTLVDVLASRGVYNVRITESVNAASLASIFDGSSGELDQYSEEIVVPGTTPVAPEHFPESQSFKITDKLLRAIDTHTSGVFVASLPAAAMMAETGSIEGTQKAIACIDTCLGGIVEKISKLGGVAIVTSTHGNCEAMAGAAGEPDGTSSRNRVPFHVVDMLQRAGGLNDNGTLADVAPTVLGLLGIEKPSEMSGSDLRIA